MVGPIQPAKIDQNLHSVIMGSKDNILFDLEITYYGPHTGNLDEGSIARAKEGHMDWEARYFKDLGLVHTIHAEELGIEATINRRNLRDLLASEEVSGIFDTENKYE